MVVGVERATRGVFVSVREGRTSLEDPDTFSRQMCVDSCGPNGARPSVSGREVGAAPGGC